MEKEMKKICRILTMNINLIFLLISITIPACLTDKPSSIISTQVEAFEYTTFQHAPLNGLPACTSFHAGFPYEDDAEDEEDILSQDCDRYAAALACYHEIHTQAGTDKTNGQPAENDLSTKDRLQIEQACANAK